MHIVVGKSTKLVLACGLTPLLAGFIAFAPKLIAGDDPLVTIRGCVPYVEPKPGEAAAGFSYLGVESSDGYATLWIHVSQRDMRRTSTSPLKVGVKGDRARSAFLERDFPLVMSVKLRLQSSSDFCEIGLWEAKYIEGGGEVDLDAVKSGSPFDTVPEVVQSAASANGDPAIEVDPVDEDSAHLTCRSSGFQVELDLY